ncbi:4Fe-4S binding protein [Adlercreutzia sp. ZJ138]|uniref:4Fe-4S binding protein n=1 Tax=Adlercreutzia sp. ZJ138 TaxID=2709405 RepID=UPI0013EC7285|nr:4Fe-4S binding protein [Adlercreutzia sp. ZJ138]
MNNDVSRIGTAANVPVGDVVRICEHIPVLRSHLACPPSLDHAVYARTTCYPAGHLVAKNAGWRNMRPVIDAEKCTNCLQCYLYCPDGAIYRVPSVCRPTELADAAAAQATPSCGSDSSSRPEGRFLGLSPQSDVPCAPSLTDVDQGDVGWRVGADGVAVDYDFCKGCGICVRMCRFGALRMIPESEANE